MKKTGGGRPQRRSGFGDGVPCGVKGQAPLAAEGNKRAFVEPVLVRHETLTRLTLVSDFGGGGGGGGTFFG